MIGLSKVLGVVLISVVLVAISTTIAMWSETLKINTYIHTGEVKVKWSAWECSDTGPDPQAPGYNNTEGKNVSRCIVTVEQNDTEGNPIKLNITLDNAYPGYAVNITLIVDNIGTIPVKLYQVNWTDLDANDTAALSLRLIQPCSTQIEPGENSTYILEIIVNQAANETATYSFDLELVFAQWNEVNGP